MSVRELIISVIYIQLSIGVLVCTGMALAGNVYERPIETVAR